ncbi:MAG: TdeIII family type II restriction endonuclease [Anaerolineales bacterium]|nr:TdeIII family type II restriction endonuclease [Anaerolineales bacterium]
MTTDSRKMKQAIQEVIKSLMERVMKRVTKEDPFNRDDFQAQKPLYAALVPEEIFKGSHFERRFVTPFGSVWEDLAVTAANHGLGFGVKGHNIFGTVKQGRLRRILEVLNSLEHPEKGKDRKKPDWETELAYILKGKGQPIPVQVTCDVYVEDLVNHKKYAFELKAPLPNSDQTKVSKEKILKLYSMDPPQIDAAYYALPYNPYGQRANYAWGFPARWFNMKEDPTVLIGNEFWEKIGGLGTYQAFIEAVNEVGEEYKERIYREYLGIEPPKDVDSGKLS